MTQIATVEKLLPGGYAEISVPRKTACGHDCEECAGCGMTGAAIRARAKNDPGAAVGQKVVVESSTSKMMHIIALVYLTPVALFLVCYLLAVAFGAGVAVQYSLAAVGFAAGIAIAIAYDRRLKKQGGLIFRIVRLF